MQRARDRVRELTARDRLRWPVEQIVGNVNQFLRGWAGYFRYGNSTVQFEQIMRHADNRLALLIAKRNQQPRRYGRQLLALQARPLRLDQPQRNHRRAMTQPALAPGSRMPAVKNVGEPCAEEPHARIEVAAGGNQASRAACAAQPRRLSPTLLAGFEDAPLAGPGSELQLTIDGRAVL